MRTLLPLASRPPRRLAVASLARSIPTKSAALRRAAAGTTTMILLLLPCGASSSSSPSFSSSLPRRSSAAILAFAHHPRRPRLPTTTQYVPRPQRRPFSFEWDSPTMESRRSVYLTTRKDANDGEQRRKRDRLADAVRSAARKFRARPAAYLLIPVIAAFVGWFTNYLAVQMIFYPIKFWGIPIWRGYEMPLGLLGWQGIVPCKTVKMSDTLVEMVTTELLSVSEVFRQLDPGAVAERLGPEVANLLQGIADDAVASSSLVPTRLGWIRNAPRLLFGTLPGKTASGVADLNRRFLTDFTVAMQDNIGSLLNVRNCVVDQMLKDRSLLGKLFMKCGRVELDFLTNSGLWFGALLGVIQMVVALFWENPWSLSIGGTIVGLATNWLALKWIFEPVNPTKIGPFILQGQFLRRQKEVAEEFSRFFAKNILSSEKLWNSILTDPGTKPQFDALFKRHMRKFAYGLAGAFGCRPGSKLVEDISCRVIERLPNHLHVLHPYVDQTLGLQNTLRTQMGLMTSAKFERVLHPIFEEDELTLIIAGGVLGFLAGLVQQGIETGVIQLPDFASAWAWIRKRVGNTFRRSEQS